MSFVKNYDPGQIRMDLPTANYIHELPLLSFADIHGTLNLSLVFNYRMKQERGNLFNIAAGYKLNLQKRLIMENSIPKMLLEEDGKCTEFISASNGYVLDNADQRILRLTGTNYTLENTDLSKEIYDQSGKLIAVYNKYNTLVLSFGHDGSSRLTSITYRGSKTISFTYSNSQLASISYSGYETSLTYAANRVMISHYSGTAYTLSSIQNNTYSTPSAPWMDFSVAALDAVDATVSSHTTALLRIADDKIQISQKIGSIVVDTTTYTFPYSALYNVERNQVEITNKTGVKTRMQYQNGILRCAYEVNGDDVSFNDEQKYTGNIQLYKTMDETDNAQAAGAIAVQDGTPMTYIQNGNSGHWEYSAVDNEDPSAAGFYLLTGWICCKNSAINAGDSLLHISDNTVDSVLDFEPALMPNMKWTFFAYKFCLNSNFIKFYLEHTDRVEVKDVCLLFNPTSIVSTAGIRHIALSEDVLIPRGSTTIIPLRDCTFTRGSLDISSYGTVTFEDILKYKINQKRGLNTSEFYCNRCKTVLTAYASSQVTAEANNDSIYNLSNCYLGRRQYTKSGEVITQVVDDNSSAFLIFQTKDSDGNVISSQSLNNYLDVISATSDGVTTNFTRNNDLVTKESVTNLYSRTTAYSTDSSGNPLITATDEFGNVTKYTLNPTWGGVKKIVLPDDTIITDTYDDDMCAMTKRTFGSATGRSTSFTYSGGDLTALQSGGLTYGFSYAKGKLTSVSKNSTNVESHTHTDTTTNSYYPSQSNALHSALSNFDKYGRLTSISDVLTNTYAVDPAFNSSGNLTSAVNNGSAQLATSTDEVRSETARFTYDSESRLLTKKEVTAEANYSTKVSEETFTYDKLDRMTKDNCTYNKTSGKKISSTITYVDGEDKTDADNRISKYTYAVIGSGTTVTQTTYDAYKRRKTKSYKIAGKTFTRTANYQKTRLDYESDSAGGSISLHYDDCGRVYLVAADGQGTKYTYDQYGQLIREDNQPLAKTYVYAYNDNGNISSVKAYNYTTSAVTGSSLTTSFGYNADKLTSFGGTSISYNTMGCPTSYDGRTATWSKGRLSRLSSGSLQQGTETFNFTYNGFGQRVGKTYSRMEGSSGSNPISSGELIACSKQFYYDHAGRLLAETASKTLKGQSATSENIVFLYDEGTIIGMEHTVGGTTSSYYFHRSPMGDVVGIYNTSGTLVAKYLYDAWGNCTIASGTTNYTVANANPIRYRGYYFDDDTGLYYCNARYYSPKWRRFISPDDTAYLDPESVNGLNLYCYCGNDPVNIVDPSGHLAFFVLTAIIGATVGVGITAVVDYVPDQELDLHWGWYVGAGLLGAAIGAGIGMAVSYYATGSVLSSTSQVFDGLINSVSLYRTVGPNELADLKTAKKFRSSRTSMEGKYFAKTRRGAAKWMNKFKQSNYVKIRVAKDKLSHDSVWIAKHLDAIDDAYYFSDLDYLNDIVNGIWINGSSFIQF